jgi:hypothetical protein
MNKGCDKDLKFTIHITLLYTVNISLLCCYSTLGCLLYSTWRCDFGMFVQQQILYTSLLTPRTEVDTSSNMTPFTT